jgi:hypothetical protein
MAPTIPSIQIPTIEDLLNDREVAMPPSEHGTFKQAEKIAKKRKNKAN